MKFSHFYAPPPFPTPTSSLARSGKQTFCLKSASVCLSAYMYVILQTLSLPVTLDLSKLPCSYWECIVLLSNTFGWDQCWRPCGLDLKLMVTSETGCMLFGKHFFNFCFLFAFGRWGCQLLVLFIFNFGRKCGQSHLFHVYSSFCFIFVH